jgi:hypothetical protein
LHPYSVPLFPLSETASESTELEFDSAYAERRRSGYSKTRHNKKPVKHDPCPPPFEKDLPLELRDAPLLLCPLVEVVELFGAKSG